jgi:hypothetical protein
VLARGAPFGGMLEVSRNHHSALEEPLYGLAAAATPSIEIE